MEVGHIVGDAAHSERTRSLAVAACLVIGAAASLVHPVAALVVFAATIGLVLADWRLSPTAVLGALLIATLLMSANYRLVGGSPIDLTANRLAIGVLVFGWVFGQLEVASPWPGAARKVNRPLGWLLAIAFATLLGNASRLAADGAIADGLKRMAALAGFVLAYSLVVALTRDRTDALRAVRAIVALGVIGSSIAIAERVTGSNPTAVILGALPFEKYQWTEAMTRAAGLRAYGTAAHPIEFGAMMSLLLPLSVYLAFSARTFRTRSIAAMATSVVAVGMLVSVSRSSVLAAVAGLVVMAMLSRPAKGATLLGLGVAATLVIAATFPDVTETLKRMLDPQWIAREEAVAYSGRMNDWPVVWSMVKARPLLGLGYDLFSAKRYFFLDNQYLKFMLELGVAGIGVIVWLFAAIASLGRDAARRSRSSEGVPLEAALLGSIAGFVLLGFLFDTFGFFQVTTLFFILVGLLVVVAPEPGRAAEVAS